MAFEKTIRQTVDHLRKAQEELRQHGAGDIVLRNVVERAALELETLGRRPTLPKSKDFENKGGEVDLDQESSATLEAGLERIVDESDLLPVSFLEQGVALQRSVGRIVLTRQHEGFPPGTGWATGFLVSPTLFLTNNHAISDAAFLQKIRIQFNFQLGPDGVERDSDSYLPESLVHTEKPLDYTLIRLKTKQVSNDPQLGTGTIQAGQRWGFIPLNLSPIFRSGQHFNIVQHPQGRRKEVALQDNTISKLFSNVVLYESDTEPGSSGSPVCDNLWQLVALHHAGGEQDANGRWLNNEGIRIDRVAEDLRQKLDGSSNAQVILELGI